MAYFSNGTEGDCYESKWCSRCVHSGKDGVQCEVMLVHHLYAYQLGGADKETDPGKLILDQLIPMDAKGLYAVQCKMFITREQVTRKRAAHETQLKLGLKP